MKDKEKQIEKMANISTKEEIEVRNKIGKEKDELTQALLHYATAEASNGIKSLIDCEGCALYLYEMLGYRKIDKDSIVLSREEYEHINSCYNVVRKETAEKFAKDLLLIWNDLEQWSKEMYELHSGITPEHIKKEAKQFGVEIKE